MIKKIVVSGIQPSGQLHIGNYLGAIKQWKELQENPDYECKFGIMDLHARTTHEYGESSLQSDIMVTKATLHGVGIDQLFIQSSFQHRIMPLFW